MVQHKRPDVPLLIAMLICCASGCAPNRDAWMAQAASQQAQVGTADIGTMDQVKAQAVDGAQVLGVWGQAFLTLAGDPNQKPDLRSAAQTLATDMATVQDRLNTIAATTDEQAFTSAILSMCSGNLPDASTHTGAWLIYIANRAHAMATQSKDPSEAASLEQIGQYDSTFGQRLVAVPVKCQQAQQAMAEASIQEQQAELNHQANVAAVTNIAAALLVGTAVYAGAVEQARINAAAQNQAAFQQWQTQIQLQQLNTELREQNYLLRQQTYGPPPQFEPSRPIQPPQ